MSTYCYYECLNHEPPLRAEEEFTQHVGDVHWKRGIEMIDARPVEEDNSYWRGRYDTEQEQVDAYFDMQARSFLSRHEKCEIGVVNEYGERLNRDGSRQ